MNILLVDDDVNVLESLQLGIDYNALGIDKVYAADNAQAAKVILNSVPVHIMITDIEMPGESGIDLLKWTKEQKMEIVTIFCTCYADFNYAKKAVELQCFDYYLKPVAFADFERIISKAVNKVRQENEKHQYYQYGVFWLDDVKNRKEHFWERVLFHIEHPDEEMLGALMKDNRLDYRTEEPFHLFLLTICEGEEAFCRLTSTMSEFIVKNVVREIFEESCGLEAAVKYENRTYVIIAKWTEAGVDAILQELITNFEIHLKCRISIYCDVDTPLKEAKTGFENLLRMCRENMNSSVSHVEQSNTVVDKMKQYINQHYAEEITRSELSKVVYLNADYMARTFKKQEGISLMDYVMKVRIKKAAELLADSDKSIHEIAIEVGYDNFSYFSRLCKKMLGHSPKDYRKMKRGECNES